MLEWLTHSTPSDDGSTIQEPPETPAPVFALRAFKSAIFGTPHPAGDGVQKAPRPLKTDVSHAAVASAQFIQAADHHQSSNTLSSQNAPTGKIPPLASPTKGILLTPGTANQRRKTVSFGAAVVDTKRPGSSHASQHGSPGDFSSSTSRPDNQNKHHRTALTKTFCDIRDQRAATRRVDRGSEIIGVASEKGAEQKGNPDSRSGRELPRDHDADVTIDVSEPQSYSGQHWKREYELYERKTRHEMKKLVKYRRMAKSYAMKKDAEATDLGEKLKTERAKVVRMEDEVSRLAAQMVSGPGLNGGGSPEQAYLMKALSKQTALALEYKRKVDRFEAALGHRKDLDNGSDWADTYADPKFEKISNTVGLDLMASAQEGKEMAALRSKVARLERTASAAEQKAAKLQDENVSLRNNLDELKEEMDQSERRRTIKGQLQRDKEEKLELRHQETVSALRKELAERTTAHSTIADNMHRQLKTLQDNSTYEGSNAEGISADLQHHQRKTLGELRQAREEASTLRLQMEAMQKELANSRAEVRRWKADPRFTETGYKSDHSVDIWTVDLVKDPKQRQSVTAATSRHRNRTDNVVVSDQTALSDISVNRSNEYLPRGLSKADPVPPKNDSSFTHPHWDLDNESSFPVLPSPEQFTAPANKSFRSRRLKLESPGAARRDPSSSPPKFEPLSLPLNTAVAAPAKPAHSTRAHIQNDHRRFSTAAAGNVPSGHALDARTTTSSLPPERMAAAKARLAQRNAERRRVQENEKENVAV